MNYKVNVFILNMVKNVMGVLIVLVIISDGGSYVEFDIIWNLFSYINEVSYIFN